MDCDESDDPIARPPNEEAYNDPKSKKRSWVWNHYDEVPIDQGQEDKTPRAACKYCGQIYACHAKHNGISTMKTHLVERCTRYEFSKKNQDTKKQKTLCFQPIKEENDGETIAKLTAVSFSVDVCTKALAEMVIIDELPFNFFEGVGFRRFMRVAQPKWTKIPSRVTIAKECLKLYESEKLVLKNALKSQRVCFTTDTWTSIQNLNYMCLTAHFIDCDWKLHKKILNFCVVPNHKGETLGKVVEQCMLDWGIDKILTVTVDNAASNNGLISFLKRKTKDRKSTILDHDYLHVRCCCHILNLVVEEGLKDVDTSIVRVRNIVKYVRSSPSRMASFRSCVEKENINCKLVPQLDVQTRWNSTCLMLERALIYRKAFERLEKENSLLTLVVNEDITREDENEDAVLVDTCELDSCVPRNNVSHKKKGKSDWKSYGVPSSDDWDMVELFAEVLKLFLMATERFSGSLYTTCNCFFTEMVLIKSEIDDLCQAKEDELTRDPKKRKEDDILCDLAQSMKRKFNKYWENFEKINSLLLYGFVLDPRYKLTYVEWFYKKSNSDRMVKEMLEDLIKGMKTLYEWYVDNGNVILDTVEVGRSSKTRNVDKSKDPREKMKSQFKMHLEEKNNMARKSEIEKYFIEGCENLDPENFDKFDVLGWWKANSARFPILSQVARDVLTIPVSTVASESAFSMGGRILDPYRSSLSPKTVEALICAQNWLRAPTQIRLRDYMEEIEKIEEALVQSNSSDDGGCTIVDL